ncbi:MAG: hypothetical protein ACM3OO_00550 [Planctomycetaceae bacterium]
MKHPGWLFGTAAVIVAAAVAFAGGFLGFVAVVAVAVVVPTAVALTLRFLAGPSRPDAPKEVRP